MLFGTHCDTSLAIAEAIISRRPFTALRMSDGEKMRQPVTLNTHYAPYHPRVAA